VVTPPGGGASAAQVCSNQPGAWAQALTDTRWISAIANCAADWAAGQYRYDITFPVPSGATRLNLSGSLLSDDNLVSVVL
jgi:hypothetical protein